MTVTVARFGAADTASVNAAFEIRKAVRAADIPDVPPLCRRQFLGQVSHPMPGAEARWLLATWNGEPAGLLELGLPLGENSENAHVTIEVHPAYRRRGVGRLCWRRPAASSPGRAASGSWPTPLDGPRRAAA